MSNTITRTNDVENELELHAENQLRNPTVIDWTVTGDSNRTAYVKVEVDDSTYVAKQKIPLTLPKSLGTIVELIQSTDPQFEVKDSSLHVTFANGSDSFSFPTVDDPDVSFANPVTENQVLGQRLSTGTITKVKRQVLTTLLTVTVEDTQYEFELSPSQLNNLCEDIGTPVKGKDVLVTNSTNVLNKERAIVDGDYYLYTNYYEDRFWTNLFVLSSILMTGVTAGFATGGIPLEDAVLIGVLVAGFFLIMLGIPIVFALQAGFVRLNEQFNTPITPAFDVR